MPQYDLIIRNGCIVLPEKVKKMDLAIKDGVIVKMETNLTEIGLEERDMYGMYIFPGVIDIHVHFSEPGRAHWEGFKTGSQMMAAGGCTTYFDMPLNGTPSTVNRSALLEKAEIGKQKSIIDFGLWGGLVPGNLEDLKELVDAGVVGFKAFLSETGNEEFERVDDVTLLSGMKEIASLNKVLALHAESAAITDWLRIEKEELGVNSADHYLESRPTLAEAEAVERALTYAKLTGCALHFVHISSRAAIEKIEVAKRVGVNVTAETCPHYLLFTHEDLIKKGAIAKCAPPLREKEEQEKLLQLLIEGKFDMISSDHSPCPYSMKDPKIFHLFEAWGGISGGQFTLLAMIELARIYDIPFPKIADWTAYKPAKRFGLESKGEIKVGMDADLAIVSVDEDFTVTEQNFFAKHKQSLYLGHTFPCRIKATISKGHIIYENGKVVDQNKKGSWVTVNQVRSG